MSGEKPRGKKIKDIKERRRRKEGKCGMGLVEEKSYLR
jgi:hypothetical protein